MKIYIDHVAECMQEFVEYTLNTVFVTGNFSITLAQTRLLPECIFSVNNATLNNLNGDNRICIEFTQEDLLHISQISLNLPKRIRLGSEGDLSVDTISKLSNNYYQQALDDIIKLTDVIPDFYNEVKGSDWPNIKTITEFYELPAHIVDECAKQFGFSPKLLTKEYPDASGPLLRKYFTNWFSGVNPFMQKQDEVVYTSNQNVYKLPFLDIFNTDKMLQHIDDIAKQFGLTLVDKKELSRNLKDSRHFHETFVKRQQWLGLKKEVDDILEQGRGVRIDLTIMQESYLNAKLGGVLTDLPRIDNTSIIFDAIG
jgi:hypothetical protein